MLYENYKMNIETIRGLFCKGVDLELILRLIDLFYLGYLRKVTFSRNFILQQLFFFICNIYINR
jgi:hypothetical protein